jgi:hypothetical protein
MEQKFGLIRCTETQKPLFAAQQLRGPASTWWANFAAIQPEGHLVTWANVTPRILQLNFFFSLLAKIRALPFLFLFPLAKP